MFYIQISLSTIYFWKRYQYTYFPSIYEYEIGFTGFLDLDAATNLGERKNSEFKPVKLWKNWSFDESSFDRGVYIYIYIFFYFIFFLILFFVCFLLPHPDTRHLQIRLHGDNYSELHHE